MSTTLNPEIAGLREKVDGYVKELAEMRGTVNQLNSIVSNSVRQSIWQLIALLVTLFVAIAGGLAYLTTSIDKRIEQMERSSNTRFEMLEKQIEQSEKNITARFEVVANSLKASSRSFFADLFVIVARFFKNVGALLASSNASQQLIAE